MNSSLSVGRMTMADPMSKYRKPFLKQFCETWARRFPIWHRGVCLPVFWARPDCTFSDTSSFSRCGLFVHVIVEFTPKRPGAFTADIIVTSSPQGYPHDRNPPPRWGEHVPDLLEGAYRIGWFFADRDFWWHLVDEEAEFRPFWESVASLFTPPAGLQRRQGDWYASSYDVPMQSIISEAVNHFCDTFEQHVLPKLNKAT